MELFRNDDWPRLARDVDVTADPAEQAQSAGYPGQTSDSEESAGEIRRVRVRQQ